MKTRQRYGDSVYYERDDARHRQERNEIGFGDQVYYFIPGHGSSAGYAFVAGEMSYAKNGDVVLLVTETAIGMP